MGKTSRTFEMIASQRPNPQFRELVLKLLEDHKKEKDVIKKTVNEYVKKTTDNF